MIQRKSNPVGVDKPIDSLQVKLNEVLLQKWNLTGSKYNCYARCYRNQADNGGYIAEVFTGTDYADVYFDDNVSAVSFFGVNTESVIGKDNVETATIQIIFFVNLAKIKPGIERNDEEARLDVQGVIDSYGASRGWQIKKQITGIDKVLSDYPGSMRDERLKFRDQHPLHCFRFDCQIFYQPTQKRC